jgi:hypothetical protein
MESCVPDRLLFNTSPPAVHLAEPLASPINQAIEDYFDFSFFALDRPAPRRPLCANNRTQNIDTVIY